MEYTSWIEVEFVDETKFMPIVHENKNVESVLLVNCMYIGVLFTNGTEKLNVEYLLEVGEDHISPDCFEEIVSESLPHVHPYYEIGLGNLGKSWIEDINVNPIGVCVN